MDHRQRRETLFTMLDENLLNKMIENNFPELFEKMSCYKSFSEKIDFVLENFNDPEKYSELLSIVSKLHTDREIIK